MFEFEMAHSLLNYDGLCKYIHGHSYKLEVTLLGKPLDDTSNPKNGMVIDFKDLKAIIKSKIIDVFDHAYVIFDKTPKKEIDFIQEYSSRTIVVDYQPTCENLTIDFVKRIKGHLSDSVSLYSVKLYETSSAYTEWYASDNN